MKILLIFHRKLENVKRIAIMKIVFIRESEHLLVFFYNFLTFSLYLLLPYRCSLFFSLALPRWSSPLPLSLSRGPYLFFSLFLSRSRLASLQLNTQKSLFSTQCLLMSLAGINFPIRIAKQPHSVNFNLIPLHYHDARFQYNTLRFYTCNCI